MELSHLRKRKKFCSQIVLTRENRFSANPSLSVVTSLSISDYCIDSGCSIVLNIRIISSILSLSLYASLITKLISGWPKRTVISRILLECCLTISLTMVSISPF